jgi:AcrR family transcriptional regulator
VDKKKPAKKTSAPCKRPYDLGKRLELSDGKRIAILEAARKQLESNGFLQLTMESLAKKSGITRQTIHNLFGTKSAVLETLFDQLAIAGGLERMREVMQQPNPETMLSAFVEVFTGFWMKDRMLIRRIHGIAAIDPEFGEVVAARNKRRQMAASRIVDRLSNGQPSNGQLSKDQRSGGRPVLSEEAHAQQVATLYALTSFEFFDALAESTGSTTTAAVLLDALVKESLLG